MLILALDTALAACSVALWGEGRILAHKSEDMARGHSERLIPMVLEVMHEAGVGFAAVTQIAATVGPGSFTGVRIALAAARGLALARHVPLIGVTTLEVVAFAALRDVVATRHIAAVIDAGRPDLFLQIFDAGLAPQCAVEALPPEQAALRIPPGPVLIAGNGIARLRPFLAARSDIAFATGSGVPNAADVAGLAATREAPPDSSGVAPVYVHAPYTKLPEDKAQ